MTTETIISKLRKRLSMLEELVAETNDLLDRAEAQLEEEMFPPKPTNDELFNAQLEENSRFAGILKKGDDGRSLHEIKMDEIKSSIA